MPTLPANISIINIILEPAHSAGVIERLSPVVLNADTHSNSTDLNGCVPVDVKVEGGSMVHITKVDRDRKSVV